MLPRSRQPYEADGGVHLHFNYWMQKTDIKAILPHEMQMICDSLLRNESPRTGLTTSKQETTNHLAVVVLNGLDAEEVSERCEVEAPFLASSSSMPIISVRKFQPPKLNADGRPLANPNLWFYNDVKSLESELLHTTVRPILASQCKDILVDAKSDRPLWENSHSLIFGLKSIDIEEKKSDDKWLVLRPYSLSDEECSVIREATISKLNNMLTTQQRLHRASQRQEFTLAYSYGKFIVTQANPEDFAYGLSTGKGYYFVDAEKSADNDEESIKTLVLVWDSGTVDVFQSSEMSTAGSVGYQPVSTQLFQAINLTESLEASKTDASTSNELLELRLSHAFPLYPNSLVSPTAPTHSELVINHNNNTNLAEQPQYPSLTSVFADIQHRFNHVSSLLKTMVVGSDTLEILGYLVEDLATIPEFVSTRNPSWSLTLHDLSNIRALPVNETQKKPSKQSTADPKFRPPPPPNPPPLPSLPPLPPSEPLLPSHDGRHIRFDSTLSNNDVQEGDCEDGEVLEDGEVTATPGAAATTQQTTVPSHGAEVTTAAPAPVETTPVPPPVPPTPSLADRITQQAIHWLFRPPTTTAAASTDVNATETSSPSHRKRSHSEFEAGFSSLPTTTTAASMQSSTYILPLDFAAMDCEMCETGQGLELTRITIVHPIHGIVLDTFVKPAKAIVNYHTEFSGVTKDKLEGIDITLHDVQTLLRVLIDRTTVLIGHSFDNDLRALRLFHDQIVDTSAMYLHPSGYPYKYALKKLTKDVLHWEIQEGDDGHDSAQDAAATLLLAIVKVNLYSSAVCVHASFMCMVCVLVFST